MAATATYQYSVRDRAGKVVTGKIDADSAGGGGARSSRAWATRR